MLGLHHAIIIFFGILGLVLSGVLIDMDHTGTWKDKWNNFWKFTPVNGPPMERGIFHNPVVMLSIFTFTTGISLGLLTHLLMDNIQWI
jgi:hypothetical protein